MTSVSYKEIIINYNYFQEKISFVYIKIKFSMLYQITGSSNCTQTFFAIFSFKSTYFYKIKTFNLAYCSI